LSSKSVLLAVFCDANFFQLSPSSKQINKNDAEFVLFRVERLLFRNIQPAPPTLSLAANVTDVILLDTKLVPCCISPSAAVTEPPNSGDTCTAKQTGNSLIVGAADSGSTELRLETGSSPTGSDRPASHLTRY